MKTTKIPTLFTILGLTLSALTVRGQQVVLTSIGQNGTLTFSSDYTNTLHKIQWVPQLAAGSNSTVWADLYSVNVTNKTTTVSIPMFFRVVAVTNNCALVGTWKWFNGDTNTFYADGTSKTVGPSGGVGHGLWQEMKGNLYALNWGSSYMDSVYLPTNGTSLGGYNQQGAHVTGTKIK